jgi:hypothetical protein
VWFDFFKKQILKITRERLIKYFQFETFQWDCTTNVPYVILGNEALALRNNLLRSFSGTHLDMKKEVFNYRLSRARRYVECAFGILTNKWRIFHQPVNVSPDFAVDIVKACTVLHDIVREKDRYNFEDILTTAGLDNLPSGQIVRGGLATS